jgi:hypothetical protein
MARERRDFHVLHVSCDRLHDGRVARPSRKNTVVSRKLAGCAAIEGVPGVGEFPPGPWQLSHSATAAEASSTIDTIICDS